MTCFQNRLIKAFILSLNKFAFGFSPIYGEILKERGRKSKLERWKSLYLTNTYAKGKWHRRKHK